MNRRTFLAGLACLPGLGFLKPEKSKLKLTEGTYGPDDFGGVPVSHKRVGIVECSTSCLPLIIECAKQSGCVIYGSRLAFDRDVVEVKIASDQFEPVGEGDRIPHYSLVFDPITDSTRFEKL